MNYFNVNANYPYLRKKFIEVAINVVKRGELTKNYHKNIVNNTLPKSVTKLISKIGGTTGIDVLLSSNEIKNIKDYCKKSNYLLKKSFKNEFEEFDYYLRILYLELFKKMFLEGNINMFLSNDFNRYKLSYFLNYK